MHLRRGDSGVRGTLDTYRFHLKDGPAVREVDFPAEYFRSPQFYYEDQKRFAVKPRQLAAAMAGKLFYPIPMELPTLTENQVAYSDYLLSSVNLGDLYVHVDELQDVVSKATASNAVGYKSTRECSEAKDIFHPANRTEPREAFERFDSKYNTTGSRQASLLNSLVKAASTSRGSQGSKPSAGPNHLEEGVLLEKQRDTGSSRVAASDSEDLNDATSGPEGSVGPASTTPSENTEDGDADADVSPNEC